MKTQPRSYWPYGIVSFFAAALVFLVSFVVWASRQREDLVAENYYDNEVHFQDRLDQLNRTAPFEGEVEVAYNAGLRAILITLPGPQARGASGRIRLYRPSDARLDRDLALALDRAGGQRLDASALSSGLWKIRVEWTVDGKQFFVERALIVGAGANPRVTQVPPESGVVSA